LNYGAFICFDVGTTKKEAFQTRLEASTCKASMQTSETELENFPETILIPHCVFPFILALNYFTYC
jgi:hypothetical protein